MVVVEGVGVLGLDKKEGMVGTCKEVDVLMVVEGGILVEEDEATVVLLVEGRLAITLVKEGGMTRRDSSFSTLVSPWLRAFDVLDYA